MTLGWYDVSWAIVDEDGTGDDDELTCNLLPQTLLNIFQHQEMMGESTPSQVNVFDADDVEHNTNDDAVDDAVGNKQPWFQDYVVEYTGGLKHL